MRHHAVIATSSIFAGALTVAVFAATLNFASPTSADIMNVAWRGEGYMPRVSYDDLGAAPDEATNTHWNNIDTATERNTVFSDLVLSDNTPATGVSLIVNSNSFTPGGATLSVFNGHLCTPTDFTDPASVTIAGLSGNHAYDLYLYSARGAFDAQQTTFTINGGASQTLPGSANTSSFVLGDNYVKFANVNAMSGSIVIQFDGPGDGVFNGFQLVSVPEPGTVALLLSGVVGLVVYRWRKQKCVPS